MFMWIPHFKNRTRHLIFFTFLGLFYYWIRNVCSLSENSNSTDIYRVKNENSSLPCPPMLPLNPKRLSTVTTFKCVLLDLSSDMCQTCMIQGPANWLELVFIAFIFNAVKVFSFLNTSWRLKGCFHKPFEIVEIALLITFLWKGKNTKCWNRTAFL